MWLVILCWKLDIPALCHETPDVSKHFVSPGWRCSADEGPPQSKPWFPASRCGHGRRWGWGWGRLTAPTWPPLTPPFRLAGVGVPAFLTTLLALGGWATGCSVVFGWSAVLSARFLSRRSALCRPVARDQRLALGWAFSILWWPLFRLQIWEVWSRIGCLGPQPACFLLSAFQSSGVCFLYNVQGV